MSRLHTRAWVSTVVALGSIGLVALVGGILPAQVERQAAFRPLPAPAKAAAEPPPLSTLGRLPQPRVPLPLGQGEPALVHVDLETREVYGLLKDGVGYRFWTFNGSVPGPMIRVRQGDTVELALRNSADSQNVHSINLHAVTGPGGGANLTQVGPANQATFRFQALHAGVYVYHCMTPMVGAHVANGMYGMVVVEPPGGLPPVDREFYMMQGDFYAQAAQDGGVMPQDLRKLQAEQPDFVAFNGAVH